VSQKWDTMIKHSKEANRSNTAKQTRAAVSTCIYGGNERSIWSFLDVKLATLGSKHHVLDIDKQRKAKTFASYLFFWNATEWNNRFIIIYCM
jgi:hypothetical protein